MNDIKHHTTAAVCRSKTIDLDLGRGLVTLLTRNDPKFLRWAHAVNLDEILAPLKAKMKEGANGR